MDKNTLLQSIYKYVKRDFDRLNIPYTRDVPIVINSRAKRRHSCCKKKDGKFIIEISEFVLDYPVDEIKNVVAHEIIHTCYGCFNHQKRFKTYGEKLKALGYKVTTTYKGEEKTPAELDARYMAVCQGCGEVIYRIRRSPLITHPQKYRCAKCRGKFKVYSINSEKI
ncbi:MAG: SprT-like domain-containing protein [Ruminococcus sp.]|nr:SprT-like domain-containing protein [Ruminococcus sp.]